MLQVRDIYRVYVLKKTTKARPPDTAPKDRADLDVKGISLPGWSDAAYGGQERDGERSVGYICSLHSLLLESRHLFH